jgi:ketosteroid isomerase-like protein
MSSANMDLVRSIFADWEQGDFSSAEWADHAIEYVFADGPHPGTWTGLAGMSRANRDFLSAWDGWRIEADEYRELDAERVLVLAHMTGRGKTSGLELTQMGALGANLFHLRDGRVIRLVLYWDRERMLSDLGLSADTGA